MADADMGLKVLVVDDHAITLAGLEGLLNEHLGDSSEVSSCSDTSDALEAILDKNPAPQLFVILISEANEQVDLALRKQLGKQSVYQSSSCIRALI